MAKLGVGIGEDFPMDDSARGDDQSSQRRAREWGRRKQAFRDFWAKVKVAARECFGEDYDFYRAQFRVIGWWPFGVLFVLSAALFLAALVTALVAAGPALVLSVALFIFVFWQYGRRHGGPEDIRPAVIVTPPQQQPPVQE